MVHTRGEEGSDAGRSAARRLLIPEAEREYGDRKIERGAVVPLIDEAKLRRYAGVAEMRSGMTTERVTREGRDGVRSVSG